MKKVVFFDGDGTLWYPRSTLRTERPHWVYTDPTIPDPMGEFIVTPNTIATLGELGIRGIKRVILSTSPLAVEEGIAHRIKITQHVDIHDLLDDVRVAPDYKEGKSEQLVALLGEYGIKAQDALMVGDNCEWDYMAAHAVGVDGVLIASEYERERAIAMGISPIIEDISGVLALVGDHDRT